MTIANGIVDLLDGAIDSPIQIDEEGNAVGASAGVWTGTDEGGVLIPGGGLESCGSWDDDTTEGREGRAGSVPGWTRQFPFTTPCISFKHLYCFYVLGP